MRIIVMVFLWLAFAGVAAARPTVLAVQSVDVAPYNEVLGGFRGACHAETGKLVISQSPDRTVIQQVEQAKPDLVLAIGLDALNAVKGLKQMPILYLMVLNPEAGLSNAPNITGVSMNIPEEQQLRLIHTVLPKANHIGVVYDPVNTGWLVARGQAAAPKFGIRLLTRKVNSPRQVATTLANLRPVPDALWLLPDVTVIRPETLEFIFEYALTQKIPIICFSEKYLELGAFMSISMDLKDMGRQAGQMANQLLSGKTVRQVPPEEVRKAVVTVNRTVAEKLGISIPVGPHTGINTIN